MLKLAYSELRGGQNYAIRIAKEALLFRKNLRLFLSILVFLLAALACGWSDPLTIQDVEGFVITPTFTLTFTANPNFTPTPEGTPPPTDKPVYAPPGLREVEKGQEPELVKSIVKSLEKTSANEGLKAETKVYLVSNSTDWDEIKNFYEDKLGGDWKEDLILKKEKIPPPTTQAENSEEEKQDDLKTVGWTYNGPTYEQVVVIALFEQKDGKKYLIVVLFSER